MPPDAYEKIGFADVLNIFSRKSMMQSAVGWQSLLAAPNLETNPVLGAYDFFDATGTRHQVVFYQDALWEWTLDSWNSVPLIAPLSGSASDYFAFEDLNYLMAFTNGVDTIQLWDGLHTTTAPASAPSSLYLMELASHLIAGYITNGPGAPFPSMYKYSGAGAPDDWTSFDSGTFNLANKLGPIRGLGKVQGIGYSVHHFGLNQIYPTGNAALPFYNFGVASQGKGCPYPRGVAFWGDESIFWPGDNDIYMFDGSNIIPIGSRKLQGGAQVGARSRIMAELKTSNNNSVYGAVSSVISGNDFNAYWLVIPNGSTWIYNIDEGSWTRRVWSGKTPSVVSRFYNPNVVTWQDLIGSWSAQTWDWDSLPVGQADAWFVGFTDGTPGLIDYSQPCEGPITIASGNMPFQDRRHDKFIKGMRMVFTDTGPFTVTFTFTNESKQQEQYTITWSGSGSNNTFQVTVPFKISGMWFSYIITGDPGTNISVVELTPVYDIAGENKTLDNLVIAPIT